MTLQGLTGGSGHDKRHEYVLCSSCTGMPCCVCASQHVWCVGVVWLVCCTANTLCLLHMPSCVCMRSTAWHAARVARRLACIILLGQGAGVVSLAYHACGCVSPRRKHTVFVAVVHKVCREHLLHTCVSFAGRQRFELYVEV